MTTTRNDASENPSALSRRAFLKVGAVAASGAAAASSLTPQATASADQSNRATRPNILIIITDQQNIDTIAAHREHFNHAAHGCGWVDTPNLDRLARRGVSFFESHSANPVCCPARSALFTGRMAIETGVYFNNIGIDQNVPNMGQWFEQESDYDRVYAGKWHAGGKWNYPNVSGNRKIPGFDTLPVGARGTGDIADYSVSSSVDAYVRNHSGPQPFLIVAGLMNPHDICYWTDHLAGKVVTAGAEEFDLEGKLPPLPPNHKYDFPEPNGRGYRAFDEMRWRNYTHDYYRMIEKIDGDVGRMMDAVDSRDDDTIIVFTSDHGEGLGRHSRVSKWHPYEQSVKVPLIVSCPGRMREDATDATHLVSGVDIMSTLCDFAGIPAPPHARGLSLRPILTGDDADIPWRDNLFADMFHVGRMIRTEQYKYVKYYKFSRDPEKPFVTKADGAHAHFVQGRGADYEENPIRLLFDMKKDPWETKNLYDDPKFAGVMTDHETILREEWEARLIPGVHYDRN